jgi:hypothetical protein
MGKTGSTSARASRRLGVVALLLASAIPSSARGDARAEANRREFAARKTKLLIEAGTRFVEVGAWCRDAGLVKQASTEFLRAVEISDGKNHWANKVVHLMRSLDERFWKAFRNEKPSKGMLAGHEKRAKAALSAYRKDRFALARWAEKKDLEEEADGEYAGYLADLGEPLDVDPEGRIRVEGATIPAAASKRLLARAVTINDRLHVPDEFLSLVPEVRTVHQAENAALRVRTQRSRALADDLLALASAAMPLLEDEVGGRPTRRLDAYVFEDRKVYESYLGKTSLASHTAATGVADGARNLVLVCAQGLDDAVVRGVVLHELAHLFQYGVTRAVMPSWYTEGFAESFGAAAAFTWKDGEFRRLGAEADPPAWAAVRKAGGYLPLERLLSADALDLITKERPVAHRFYAQSWAFYVWLTTAAPKDVQQAFALWETICGGKALGAEAGKAASRNSAPAAELFRARLGGRLPEIEAGFRAWLRAE